MKPILTTNPYGDDSVSILFGTGGPLGDKNKVYCGFEYGLGRKGEVLFELPSDSRVADFFDAFDLKMAQKGILGRRGDGVYQTKDFICPIELCAIAQEFNSKVVIFLYPRSQKTLEAFQQLTKQPLTLNKKTVISTGEILSTQLAFKANKVVNTELSLPQRTI